MPQTPESYGSFTSDSASMVFMSCGEIVAYNPETDLYTVDVFGVGDVDAVRAMKNGVYRPYPENTKVVCLRVRTIQWIILGGIPNWESPEDPPQSPTDTTAEQDKKKRRATADKFQVFAASARKVAEEVHYDGDSVLDNGKGSFIKILESGDIWGLASFACFFLFSTVRNICMIRARDALISFTGFILGVETDTSIKRATAKLDVTGDQKADTDPDFSVRMGYLGGQNLFEQEAKKSTSALPELTLAPTNVAGGTGIVSTADVGVDDLPTQSASVSDTLASGAGAPSAAKDGRVLWSLFGSHALMEVDNSTEEVRLSRVSVQRNSKTNAAQNTETEIKQFRMNGEELAFQWKDRLVTLNESRISCSYGDNYLSIDDKKASLVFGENFIIVNDNGVQIKGYLELVGGSINLVASEQAKAIRPELGGVAKGGVANMSFSMLPLPLLDLTMSMTVNKLALVNETFLPAYDIDMQQIQTHSHPLDPQKTTALPDPKLSEALDQPTKQTQKSALTSKII